MKWLLVFLFLSLFAPGLCAQTAEWRLSGRVFDESGQALPGATIQADSLAQAVTDAAGRFNLTAPRRPQSLVVRCIGYFPQRIALDTLPFANRTEQFALTLTPRETALPEIAVRSKPMESIFQEDFQSDLLDYAFAGKDLLLLARERRQYLVRLTDDDGRKLSELRLPDRALKLHRSCTGDLHVVGERWCWEITLQGTALDTFPRYTAELFHQLIEPCVLEQNGCYIFQRIGPYRQSILYYYYAPDGKKQSLALVRDEKAEAELLRQHRAILAAYMQTIPDVDRDDIFNGLSELTDPNKVLDPNNLVKMAETNKLVAAVGNFNTLAADSIYAPLIQIGARVYLFDHVNDALLNFQLPSSQNRQTPLTYHHARGWQKEVLADAALERAYGRFRGEGGALLLQEIDLKNGGAGKAYPLKIVPYLAERFQLRNGLLYFIGQPNVNIPNKRLYKVNLFAFAR